MDDLHEELKSLFAAYIRETEEFEQRHTKVSAVRARKALQDLKRLIPSRRAEIQEKKNNT
jgi:hypothetical protein